MTQTVDEVTTTYILDIVTSLNMLLDRSSQRASSSRLLSEKFLTIL